MPGDRRERGACKGGSGARAHWAGTTSKLMGKVALAPPLRTQGPEGHPPLSPVPSCPLITHLPVSSRKRGILFVRRSPSSCPLLELSLTKPREGKQRVRACLYPRACVCTHACVYMNVCVCVCMCVTSPAGTQQGSNQLYLCNGHDPLTCEHGKALFRAAL